MMRWTLACLLLVLAGCSATGPNTEIAALPADLQLLPVRGPWENLAGGLRMRLCVDRTIAEETGIIRAALLMENTSATAVSLEALDNKQSLCIWGVDNLFFGESTPGRSLSLAPKQTWVSPMIEISMPAGAPRRLIRAQLTTRSIDAFASIPITVTPARWGEPAAGLRLRLSMDRERYAAGEAAVARLFLHNTTDQPVNVHPLDHASRKQDSLRERITLSYTTIDQTVVPLGPGGFVAIPLGEPLLLAPGRYKLQAVIESRELSADHPIAWFGTLVSNEVEIVVE